MASEASPCDSPKLFGFHQELHMTTVSELRRATKKTSERTSDHLADFGLQLKCASVCVFPRTDNLYFLLVLTVGHEMGSGERERERAEEMDALALVLQRERLSLPAGWERV